MFGSFLFNYFNDLRTTLNESLLLVKKSYDPDAIHKVRVSIKKLRALFFLAEELDLDSFLAKKEYKPLRKLFKEIGEIRDIQVQIGLMEEQDKKTEYKLEGYLNHLKDLRSKRIKKFEHSVTQFDKQTLNAAQEKLETLKAFKKDSEVVEDVLSFIEGRLKKATRHKRKTTDKRLHKTRRNLKQVHYLTEILTQYYNNSFGIPVEQVDNLQQMLGDWHDLLQAKLYLKDYVGTNQHIEKKYRHLLRDTIKRKEDLEKRIMKDLRALRFEEISSVPN